MHFNVSRGSGSASGESRERFGEAGVKHARGASQADDQVDSAVRVSTC